MVIHRPELAGVRPEYVYVASSWRNPMQPPVVAALRSAGIDCYDFRNPESGTGFSWRQVKEKVGHEFAPYRANPTICSVCGAIRPMPCYEHVAVPSVAPDGIKPKGSDWEHVDEYLRMIEHPRALAGFDADFDAMKRADTFVMVLPCGKSAHLELGWAAGAGKRTAILLEDPVEPELMYRCADYLAASLFDLLGWLGVED